MIYLLGADGQVKSRIELPDEHGQLNVCEWPIDQLSTMIGMLAPARYLLRWYGPDHKPRGRSRAFSVRRGGGVGAHMGDAGAPVEPDAPRPTHVAGAPLSDPIALYNWIAAEADKRAERQIERERLWLAAQQESQREFFAQLRAIGTHAPAPAPAGLDTLTREVRRLGERIDRDDDDDDDDDGKTPGADLPEWARDLAPVGKRVAAFVVREIAKAAAGAPDASEGDAPDASDDDQ